MPPLQQRLSQCQVCSDNVSKYTCAQCRIAYCSVACYKEHKNSSCQKNDTNVKANELEPEQVDSPSLHKEEEEPLSDPPILRPLTSLKWPYIQEESAYPDPLKRDDPKVLQLHQYEAIATSPTVRRILETKENLPALLQSIDKLRGREREEALQKALGVTPSDVQSQQQPAEPSEDVLALREFAEAIEAAVRGQNPSALGLNWGE